MNGSIIFITVLFLSSASSGLAEEAPLPDTNDNCQMEKKNSISELNSELRSMQMKLVKKECSDEENRIEQQFRNEVKELVANSQVKREMKTKIEDLTRKKLHKIRQHDVDCKMEYARILHGEDFLKNQVVPGLQLELYSIRIFSHCALSVKNDNGDVMQIEMVPAGFENITQYGMNTKISLFGFIKKGIADIYRFPNSKVRKEMSPGDWAENISQPICSKDPQQQSSDYYRNCLNTQVERYANSRVDPSKKNISYDPLLNNCCHFVEKLLNSCGLISCFGFPRSSGLDLGFKKGALKAR